MNIFDKFYQISLFFLCDFIFAFILHHMSDVSIFTFS